MKSNTRHIESLLERFFEGAASSAEERELYAFFAAGDVPEPLRKYRELFAWFDGGIEEEFLEEIPKERPRPKRRLGLWGAAAAVAAVVVVALTIRPAERGPYAGSYVVIAGRKITDPAIVGPEVEAARRRIAEEEALRECEEWEAHLIAELAWCEQTEEWLKSL